MQIHFVVNCPSGFCYIVLQMNPENQANSSAASPYDRKPILRIVLFLQISTSSAHAGFGIATRYYVPVWHRTTNSYYVNTPADISSFHLWYSTPQPPNHANCSQIRHKCHASLNMLSQGLRLSIENEEVTGPLLKMSVGT